MSTEATPQVPVAPLPTITNVGTAQGGGQSWVLLQAQTPQGVAVFFLEPDHAKQLARHLTDNAVLAGTGLFVAGADAVPTPPNGVST